MCPFSIGVMIGNYNLPFVEALDKAAELCLDGIQLSGTRDEFRPDRVSAAKRAELRTMLADRDLTLSAVCGEQMFGFTDPAKNPQLIENSKQILDMAKDLGSDIVTTHIGVVPSDPGQERFHVLQDACGELARYADSIGSHFAIETGPEKAVVLKAFLDTLGTKGVAVNLDPGNLVMCAGDDAVQSVYTLRDYIVHTHAKDGRQLKAEDLEHLYATAQAEQYHGVYIEEMLLGQGNVHYPRYLKALNEIGYHGFLTIERECSDSPVTDIAFGAGYLRSLISGY